MKQSISLFCFVVILVFLPLQGFSQISTDSSSVSQKPLYKIIKNNDVEYIGEVLSDDGREVLILTKALGKIYIPKADIKSMTIIERETIKKDDINFRGDGPFSSRYYFTTNALPIKKNEHYAMIHLYGPEVHFALSDRFSLGIMTSWAVSPVGLAAKYAFKSNNEKLHFSLGTILLHSGYIRINQSYYLGGLHWGSVTYGSPGNNISFTAGYGYTNFNLGTRTSYFELTGIDPLRQAPIVSVAGIKQVGRKASFIFDSMIASSQRYNFRNIYVGGSANDIILYNAGTQISAIMMPGVRFQKTERKAFQVALAGVVQYSTVGFNYNEVIDDDVQKSRSFPIPMCSWFFKL